MTDSISYPPWLEVMMSDALKKAQKKHRAAQRRKRFEKYQDDPVGFGEEVLGESFTDDVKKVLESVRDFPVTIARSANGTGKTHGAARAAAWFYKCFKESQVYATAAPPMENLKNLLWGELMTVIEKNPDVFKYDRIRNLHISMGVRHFITGVAIPQSGTKAEREAKFSGKHAPYLLFIVDEGDAVPDEIYSGIESCMSGGMTRLLIMFNPRDKRGPVYLRERNRTANVVELSAFNHPNVITGDNLIPGAVDRPTTVRRINLWTRPISKDEKDEGDTFEVPDFLVGSVGKSLAGDSYPPLEAGKRKIKQPEFSYMVLGEYPAQSELQLISQIWIDNARARYDLYVAKNGEKPPAFVQPILGLDIAEYGIDANTACLRYGSFVPPIKSWSGVDPDLSSDEALQLYLSKNAKVAMVDATGVGAGVAPSMVRKARAQGQRDVRAISVKVAASPSKQVVVSEEGEFYQLRDQLWWAVREWLRTDSGAMLPPDSFLLEELTVPHYRKRASDGKIVVTDKDTIRDKIKRSPDRADALCLTFAPFERPKIISLGI